MGGYEEIMKTLIKGRSAVRVTVLALLSVVGLATTAHAQDFSGLDPAKKIINVEAGPDQTVEAGTGVVNFNAVMTGYVLGDSPVNFFWINQTTNAVDELGQDASEQAPRQDTTFRLVAWNFDTGEWGDRKSVV